MSQRDIVERLRWYVKRRYHEGMSPPQADAMTEAAAEIERLRASTPEGSETRVLGDIARKALSTYVGDEE